MAAVYIGQVFILLPDLLDLGDFILRQPVEALGAEVINQVFIGQWTFRDQGLHTRAITVGLLPIGLAAENLHVFGQGIDLLQAILMAVGDLGRQRMGN